jgi:hypothetical protein
MLNSSSGSISLRTATAALTAAFALLVVLSGAVAMAQSPQAEQKLMAIKDKMAANKQQLAQYTWQETETIAIKGDVKDSKVYQVQMGPYGPQKQLVADEKAQSGGGGGRIKKHVVEKKKEEYQEYGEQIGALAKQYTTPDPARLMEAKQQGNVSLQLGGGGTVNLVVKNYLKPNDQLMLTIDDQTKAPVAAQIKSYLKDPSDAVTISANFAQLPDGTNHVATSTINGVSKQLTVSNQNANYQKILR